MICRNGEKPAQIKLKLGRASELFITLNFIPQSNRINFHSININRLRVEIIKPEVVNAALSLSNSSCYNCLSADVTRQAIFYLIIVYAVKFFAHTSMSSQKISLCFPNS